MRDTCGQLNRVLLLNMLVSVTLVALSLGVVTTDETLEISGISFSMKLSTLLSFGCVLGAILMLSFRGLQRYRSTLADEFWEILKPLGIESPEHEEQDPFGSPTLVESLLDIGVVQRHGSNTIRNIGAVVTIVVAIGISLFPVVAQTVAAVEIGQEAGWPFASVTLLAAPAISLFALIAMVAES